MPNYITKYCILRENKVILNNGFDHSQETSVIFPDFIRSVYKNYQIKYPNFFKMDNLSKLAFITAELLLMENDFISRYEDEEIGMVIANSGSSSDTDIKFYDTIKDSTNYFPSPSVFVYTLPNIMIGEICIRNKIKGENAFFVFEKFEPGFICNYANNLLDTGKAQGCIAGWVDLFGDNYESILYLVEKKDINGNNMINNAERIEGIYKSNGTI